MEEKMNVIIDNFCSAVENHIGLVPAEDPKFIRQNGLLVMEDRSLPVMRDEGKELDEYKELLSLLAETKEFKHGITKLGRWCTGDDLINWMITKAIEIEDEGFRLNRETAKSYLENFKNTVTSKEVNYTLFQRILGLELTVKRIELDEGVFIVSLTDRELNRRMPHISTLDIGMPYLDLTNHPAEIRCTVFQKFKKVKYDLLRAKKEIKEELLDMSKNVFASLLLAKGGSIELGPHTINLIGADNALLTDDEDTIIGREMRLVFSEKVVISEEDIENLKKSYTAAKKIHTENEVLKAALERFELGAKRLKSKDRLVDYVIAWEALLLTTEGKAGKSELSYRFALNGSSVLHLMSDGIITREEGFSFMKGLYACRSMMVHGAGKKNLQKELDKINISDLDELAEKVGEYLRKAILWLSEIEEKKRPYKEKWGWEKILWYERA